MWMISFHPLSSPKGGYCYYPHFAGKVVEAQKVKAMPRATQRESVSYGAVLQGTNHHLKLTVRSRGDPAKSPMKVHGSCDGKRVPGQECTY